MIQGKTEDSHLRRQFMNVKDMDILQVNVRKMGRKTFLKDEEKKRLNTIYINSDEEPGESRDSGQAEKMINYTTFMASLTSSYGISKSVSSHNDVSDDNLFLEDEDLEGRQLVEGLL